MGPERDEKVLGNYAAEDAKWTLRVWAKFCEVDLEVAREQRRAYLRALLIALAIVAAVGAALLLWRLK